MRGASPEIPAQPQHYTLTMKKLIQLIAPAGVALAALALTSCGCCTGEAKAPSLRSLPKFKELLTIDYGDPPSTAESK